jgi:hypothetical protein
MQFAMHNPALQTAWLLFAFAEQTRRKKHHTFVLLSLLSEKAIKINNCMDALSIIRRNRKRFATTFRMAKMHCNATNGLL